MNVIEALGSLEKSFSHLGMLIYRGQKSDMLIFVNSYSLEKTFWNTTKGQEEGVHLHYSQRNKIA